MKRVDLIRQIEAMGYTLIRHGGKHDWYRSMTTGMSQAVPRHREINERLARKIIDSLRDAEASGSTAGDDT